MSCTNWSKSFTVKTAMPFSAETVPNKLFNRLEDKSPSTTKIMKGLFPPAIFHRRFPGIHLRPIK